MIANVAAVSTLQCIPYTQVYNLYLLDIGYNRYSTWHTAKAFTQILWIMHTEQSSISWNVQKDIRAAYSTNPSFTSYSISHRICWNMDQRQHTTLNGT